MKDSLVNYLCCPVDRTTLRLMSATRDARGNILGGSLVSTAGRTYPIVDGVPDLTLPYRTAEEEATVDAFGREWARYDDVDGAMGSAELFRQFTGLEEEQIRGKRVLEVGCGGGRWLKVLAELGASQVVGLEYSTSVRQASRRVTGLENVEVVRGSALEMPFQRVFDLVVSVGVIHHLSDPVAGLAAFRRAAADGHLVVFWVYAREGNELYLSLVGPVRRVTSHLPDRMLAPFSRLLALALWSYAQTINRGATALGWRLPLRDYLSMLTSLRFKDIESVVYDQLAPQIARYPTRAEVLGWVRLAGGEVRRLHHRTGNSWQCHIQFSDVGDVV